MEEVNNNHVSEERQVRLHELCRGAFEPLRSAIPSDLLLLPGCHLLHEEAKHKETVLEHIILDMTGSSAQVTSSGTTSDNITDADNASLQRTLRRTKRLLTRTNSVLLFRLVTMVIVALMLMVTTFVTWNFTRNFSGHSITNLSSTLRREILRSSLNTVVHGLTQTYSLCLTLNAMHRHQFVARSNDTWSNRIQNEIQSINWGFFQTQRNIYSVAFISNDGHVTDFTRKGHEEYLYFTSNSSKSTKVTWYAQPVTDSLNGSVSNAPLRSVDGPFEDSYIAELLRHQQDQAWNIKIGDLQKHSFSSAVPVIHPETQHILGMSVVSTSLKEAHHDLREANILGGYLYFFRLNASGGPSLVATSCSHLNDSNTDVSSCYSADVASYLSSVYGNKFLLQNETHSEDVRFKEKIFYVDSMPMKSKFDFLNLIAVIVVPRTSIMGEIDARSKTVIKVSAVAALGILVIGSVLICFLTRRMSTEMQLRQELIRQLVAKHKAEQSSNHKTQFLANMSHEMRTPMAGIIGLLDLLACDTLTPDQEMSVAQIRRCATGLLALVNNVLDISKVEAGKMDLEVAPFNIMEELESLVDMFAVQLLGSSVDVMLDFSDEFPYEVKGDVARMRQIFTNLLSNSVKFTETGHILIRGWIDQSLLTLSRKSVEDSFTEAGDMAKITGNRHSKSSTGSESHKDGDKIALIFEIDDTGCGIPATMEETVFDRFVQADASTTRTHGGSGLGLYIVKSLVNMMGGEVQIITKPGPGTRVRFHLILDRVHCVDGTTIEFNGRGVCSNSEDALSAFVGSPTKHCLEARFPTKDLLMRTHALVALSDTITKSITVDRLQKKGVSVSCVNSWEDMLPSMNKLCKFSLNECSSGMPGGTMKDVSCLCPESPSSPFALPSAGSSSCVSDITNRYPVLALIDISLIPTICKSHLEKGPHSMQVSPVTELEQGKIPESLKYLMNALHHMQTKSDVLVAWIVPPKSSPLLKRVLLSLMSSVVIKKPLHASRMRWLLSLLTDGGKLEQSRLDILGYSSSDPSTPRLTAASSPLKNTANFCNFLNSSSMCNVQGSNMDDAPTSNINLCSSASDKMVNTTMAHRKVDDKEKKFLAGESTQHIFVKLSQEDILGVDGSSISMPESPTSGLITPEGANSIADGVQEIRKESDIEWEGPVLDLIVPNNANYKTKQMKTTKTSSIVQFGMLNVSASESPSTTEPPSPQNVSIAGGQTPGVLSGMHILLVEDTPVLQRLASMMLKKLGAEVTIVGDGLQAVELVAQTVGFAYKSSKVEGGIGIQETSTKDFDLILMDCAMPVMDGYSATRAIREAEVNTGRHIPIVALTAHALASDEEKCLSVGMDAYLTKPINCKQLVSTVKELVRR